MSCNFQETAIFHLWEKVLSLLSPFSPVILKKTDIKKKNKFRRSYLKAESSFNILQNSVSGGV